MFRRCCYGTAAGIGVALQALKVGAHLSGNLVAQISVLFERLVDDVLELGWEIGVQAQRGRGGAVEDCLEDGGGTFSAKREHTGRHLVEHRAEGKQVAPRVQFLAPGLLRRHVGDGADGGAGIGQLLVDGERVGGRGRA